MSTKTEKGRSQYNNLNTVTRHLLDTQRGWRRATRLRPRDASRAAHTQSNIDIYYAKCVQHDTPTLHATLGRDGGATSPASGNLQGCRTLQECVGSEIDL